MPLSGWTAAVKTVKNQLFLSRSLDPFVNLSIEHYLLTKSPKHSNVCFVYLNRPCVVIGRNQNPWLEVNFPILKSPDSQTFSFKNGKFRQDKLLVRRRSGGGTVFHDEGNVNYCAICPPETFTRDRHAEMVTHAIRTFNPRARVNQRHDIVLDQGDKLDTRSSPLDMHSSDYTTEDPSKPPLKISGSAFKLIKNRALHHGTCLLNSERLGGIGQYLHSPARGFITAKGVESVRSLVGNAIEQSESQERKDQILQLFPFAVLNQFQTLYGIDARCLDVFRTQPWPCVHSALPLLAHSSAKDEWVSGVLGDEVQAVSEIRAGMQELKSKEWLFDQTPKFTLSSHPTTQGGTTRLPADFPPQTTIFLDVKHGKIAMATLTLTEARGQSMNPGRFKTILTDKLIRQIADFERLFIREVPAQEQRPYAAIGRWLNTMFGLGDVDGRVQDDRR